MKNFLYSENQEKANSELIEIGEKRQENAKSLEVFRLAVKALIRKDPRKGDVEDFLILETEKDVETKAVARWLKMENVKLDIDPSLASSAMTLPDVVTDLVNSWNLVNGKSENPMKYWSDTKMVFKVIPISNEDKETVIERNKRYAKSEERLKMLNELQRQLDLVNFANKLKQGVSPQVFATAYPVLFAFSEPHYTKLHSGASDMHNPKYYPKMELFLEPRKSVKVFDDI